MNKGKLHVTSAQLAFALGAKLGPPEGKFLEILIPGGRTLYWPLIKGADDPLPADWRRG